MKKVNRKTKTKKGSKRKLTTKAKIEKIFGGIEIDQKYTKIKTHMKAKINGMSLAFVESIVILEPRMPSIFRKGDLSLYDKGTTLSIDINCTEYDASMAGKYLGEMVAIEIILGLNKPYSLRCAAEIIGIYEDSITHRIQIAPIGMIKIEEKN